MSTACIFGRKNYLQVNRKITPDRGFQLHFSLFIFIYYTFRLSVDKKVFYKKKIFKQNNSTKTSKNR